MSGSNLPPSGMTEQIVASKSPQATGPGLMEEFASDEIQIILAHGERPNDANRFEDLQL
jgi:hypothetical protein